MVDPSRENDLENEEGNANNGRFEVRTGRTIGALKG